MKVEISKNKTGNETKNAQSTLADINAQIEVLNQQRLALVEPQKARYVELRAELQAMETTIRELDPSWRPEISKAKCEVKISEVLKAKGQPMSAEEIVQAVKGQFNSWKTKNTLKKKSEGEKAVFAVSVDGKYSLKPTSTV